MAQGAPAAFFSYCRDDSEFALRLAEDLKAAGANVWIDQLDIEPGMPWDRAVENAVTNCPRMLVLLSPTSVNSDNVRDEISFALSKQKRVIPVLYRDCDVPFRVALLQHIDFRVDYARGLKALLRTLGVEQQAVASGGAALSVVPKESQPDVSDVDERKREAERARLEDERKQAADQARLEEQSKLATEQARLEEEGQQAAEQLRLEEERKQAEQARVEQEHRRAAEEARLEDERRKAAEQARVEEERKQVAEQARLEQERRRAVEEARLQDEHRKSAEQAERTKLERRETDQVIHKKLAAQAAATDVDEKLRLYNEAIRLKPDDASAFFNRGNARRDKGDVEGALKDYNEAIRLKPDYASAFFNRGIVRRDMGGYAAGLQRSHPARIQTPRLSS